MTLPPWTQAVRLHPDVASGETAVSLYAIDLGELVRGGESVSHVYRDARSFFNATHMTDGLSQLLEDILARLSGEAGDRVLQLHSPFGGGKTHSLASIFYTVTDFKTLQAAFPKAKGFHNPGKVRVAVFDGEKFDVRGKAVNGHHIQTMWGDLAAQLDRYDLMEYHDKNRVPPGGDVIQSMLGDKPTLLLLDEVLMYVERVSAELIGDSNLGRLTQAFLQTLSVEVANTKKAALLYSLQASINEAFGNPQLLAMLDHLTSRVDAKREPVTMKDTLPVVRRRLLDGAPNENSVLHASSEYAGSISTYRRANAATEAERRAADAERMQLQDAFAQAYPFHPELINLMRERWTAIPNFQRTRGALRFLAVCLQVLHMSKQARALLGPGDVPLEDPKVQQAFFSEVGQRDAFRAVLERDFFGPNARVKQIDERMATENPATTGVNPAMRLATAILMYSFGGLTRANADANEPMAVGVTESELLSAVIGPDLDGITAQAALTHLRNQCLYLHFDGVHYAFKTTPNVTQVLEDFARRQDIKRDIDPAIREELSNRLQGRTTAFLWPADSQYIPNKEPRFLLGYLPLDFAFLGPREQQKQAISFFTHYGDNLRRYRNGVGLAIPNAKAVGDLREAKKYLLAIQGVNSERSSLGLTTTQLAELKEREKKYRLEQESAVRSLYESIWLPKKLEEKEIEIEKVELKGRLLSSSSVHERLIELLKISPPHLFTDVTPERILDLMRLGIGKKPRLGIRISEIVDTFYSTLSFPRLETSAAIGSAIVDGVQRGLFGYIGRAGMVDEKQLGEDSSSLIDPSLVRINASLPELEIDEGSALIVLPQAMSATKKEEPVLPVDISTTEAPPVSVNPTPSDVDKGTQPQRALRQFVRLSMQMSRQQLYASWNAIKNLIEKAGSVHITIEAQNTEGFDETWLRNAVLEPLEEADIEVDQGN
jgi:hypothetical protein